jgi:acetyltransferase-like isoleucine patch superfamily enzyme
VIGHDTVLGDFTHVYSLVSIGGNVLIDNGASVFPGARIVPRVKIGEGATVGIGSVVMRNVAPEITVFGVPAVQLKII